MPLQEHHQIISVDDHLIEPPTVWIDRITGPDAQNAPRIITSEHGHHIWLYEGRKYPQVGLNAVAGRPMEEYGVEPLRYEDMIPGCYQPGDRLLDMDLDGVQAALCFPSFPGFAGGTFHRADNKDLALRCVRAWNDFHLDEWCASAPDRFIPSGILPTWDIELATAEARRLAARGFRTISFPDSPVPLGMPSFLSRAWDPLWDVLSQEEMCVCLHFGSSGFMPGFPFGAGIDQNRDMEELRAPFAIAIALFSSNLQWSTVELLFSGTLQRFPKLQFMLSEGGIGWIPYILERTDQTWHRHRWYQDIDKQTRPSDLFRQHFYGCFIDDDFGIENRHKIGVERILVEIDYPHSDSNWPNSRKRISEAMADVPDHEVALIVEDNARRAFRFPRNG
jgi:predicted TIM-barrel fold metal-dependent hydrolase